MLGRQVSQCVMEFNKLTKLIIIYIQICTKKNFWRQDIIKSLKSKFGFSSCCCCFVLVDVFFFVSLLLSLVVTVVIVELLLLLSAAG